MAVALKESCWTSRSLAEVVAQDCGLSEEALTLLFPAEDKLGPGVAPNLPPSRRGPHLSSAAKALNRLS